MIEDKFGEDVIETDEKNDELHVIHTGSLSLDVSLGIGGLPLGRISTIWGPESSAKTSLALTIASNVINQYGKKVLYVDVEQAVDYEYMRAIVGKFDESMFVLVKPHTAEDAMKICEMGIRSKEFALVVLDSVGALAPEAELKKELGERSMGLIPTLMSSFLRRNAFFIRSNNVGLLIINQVRASIGTYTGGYDMPGGHALRHFSSIIIQLYKAEQIKVGEKEEVIGCYSRYIIKKNKLATPFKSYNFPLIYGRGIDYVRDVVDFSEMLGILDKRGSYYAFEGETIAQGLVKTCEYLKEHKEVLDKLVERCYNTTKLFNQKGEEGLDDAGDFEQAVEVGTNLQDSQL
jgi:recombination protein RecA